MSESTKDSVEYIANKFAENTGHFAATILRMYWDMEKQCDQFKSERDTLTDDIAVLKAKVSKLKRENGELQEVYSKAKAWDRMHELLIDKDIPCKDFDDEMYELLKKTVKTDIRIITGSNIDLEDNNND